MATCNLVKLETVFSELLFLYCLKNKKIPFEIEWLHLRTHNAQNVGFHFASFLYQKVHVLLSSSKLSSGYSFKIETSTAVTNYLNTDAQSVSMTLKCCHLPQGWLPSFVDHPDQCSLLKRMIKYKFEDEILKLSSILC